MAQPETFGKEKMKSLAALIVLALAGCKTSPSIGEKALSGVATAVVAKEATGLDSVALQLSLGSARFLEMTGRWPQTKEEIIEGLAAAKLPSGRMEEVTEIKFREEGGALLVDFVATGKIQVSGSLRVKPPADEVPNQSSQPTPVNRRG